MNKEYLNLFHVPIQISKLIGYIAMGMLFTFLLIADIIITIDKFFK